MNDTGKLRVTVMVDDFEILVGRSAQDNDTLTFKVAEPHDFWLHASGYAGSHVIIRNPDRKSYGELPRAVVERAAALAAYHSKAREARGKVEVHVCRASEVRKPKGFPPGKVELRRWDVVRVYPRTAEGG
ncbi:MAG: NFACT RNA binding domain-containing protein [Actinomycetota bacterium]